MLKNDTGLQRPALPEMDFAVPISFARRTVNYSGVSFQIVSRFCFYIFRALHVCSFKHFCIHTVTLVFVIVRSLL
ncbi:hypothetical protein DSECCO2_111070 [anaerobic digester metagenome]